MSLFELYFKPGIQHIARLKGYHHILFINTLCGVFSIKRWRRVLILITAFTPGHSLATRDLIRMDRDLIEFLIPLTIFLTSTLHKLTYSAALLFGSIHGLGFSNYLRGLLGDENGLALPLFSFS